MDCDEGVALVGHRYIELFLNSSADGGGSGGQQYVPPQQNWSNSRGQVGSLYYVTACNDCFLFVGP